MWVVRNNSLLTANELLSLVMGPEVAQRVGSITGPLDMSDKGLAAKRAGHVFLRVLNDLEDAGLIECDATRYQVSSRLDFVQEIFDISLGEYAYGRAGLIRASPIFGTPLAVSQINWPDIFVLMPFTASMKTVYDVHILEAAKKLGLSCKRGDDFFSSQSVIDEIWGAIYHSKVCIADCTGRNPNVFYELGIAHTLGRPCILTAQSLNDIPFDVRHRRVIIYTQTPEGLIEFEQDLERALRNELNLKN